MDFDKASGGTQMDSWQRTHQFLDPPQRAGSTQGQAMKLILHPPSS